jgi:hypothetical protein
MIQSVQLPPNRTVKRSTTDQKKKPFEPPMHTDAHRSKADKEKQIFKPILFILIMSLSVFIGVHRWLKIIVFNFLNQDLSVCSSCGSL